MLQGHLLRMADNLIKNGLIEQNQREGAINAMREEWQDKMAISFGVGNIQAVAAENGINLEKFEAQHILNYFRNIALNSCGMGLSMDAIDIALANCAW